VGLPGNAPAGTVGERVVALDGRTGARRWAARWPAATVEGLAFSPDGRLLAATSRGDEVRVLDAATGETLLAIGGLRAPSAVAWG
jgi:outer membrane protein assembly factor BamB